MASIMRATATLQKWVILQENQHKILGKNWEPKFKITKMIQKANFGPFLSFQMISIASSAILSLVQDVWKRSLYFLLNFCSYFSDYLKKILDLRPNFWVKSSFKLGVREYAKVHTGQTVLLIQLDEDNKSFRY